MFVFEPEIERALPAPETTPVSEALQAPGKIALRETPQVSDWDIGPQVWTLGLTPVFEPAQTAAQPVVPSDIQDAGDEEESRSTSMFSWVPSPLARTAPAQPVFGYLPSLSAPQSTASFTSPGAFYSSVGGNASTLDLNQSVDYLRFSFMDPSGSSDSGPMVAMFVPVPEPQTWGMIFATGLLGFGAIFRARTRKS